MSTTKTKNITQENNNMDQVNENKQPQPSEIEQQQIGDQAKIAARIAASISPVIAREILSGKISFAALTVIVDNKYSGTFPFQHVLPDDATDQEKHDHKLNTAKNNMLAAIEFSRTLEFSKTNHLDLSRKVFLIQAYKKINNLKIKGTHCVPFLF